MIEGGMPPPVRPDPLLPEPDWQAAGGHSRFAQRVAAERCDYLSAVATSPHRELSYPVADPASNREAYPSRWFLEQASFLEGSPLQTDNLSKLRDRTWLTVDDSAEHALIGADEASLADRHDYNLHRLLRWRHVGRRLLDHPFTQDETLSRATRLSLCRNQSRLTEYDGNLSALAGEGGFHRKLRRAPVSATSLEKRVVNLVAGDKTTLDRIAAITFTEAAAELRDRVREGLEVAAADASRGEDERARCTRGITDLDQASIRTLHSFAATLLRDRPLEAGLPPGFETTDEIAAGIRFNEAWDDWIDEALEEDSFLAPHLALALTLGMTLAHLKNTAREFHGNYADLSGETFDSSPRTEGKAVDTLLKTWPELERLSQYSKLGDDDALYTHVQSRTGAARRLAVSEPGSPIAYRLLCQMLPLKCGKGSQKNWDIDPETGFNACKALKGRLNELQNATEEELDLVRRAVLKPILAGLRQFALDYANQRRREGRAEFHDLLVWAGEPPSGCAPRVWTLSDMAVDADIDTIRRKEAGEIARLLRRMVDNKWQKLDGDATRASDDPGDQVAVFAALRSPATWARGSSRYP